MRAICASCLLLALASALVAADVRLPVPPAPEPVPQPMPGEKPVYQLAADGLYLFDSDAELVIRTVPDGLLSVEKVEGGTHHWREGGAWKKWKSEKPHAYRGVATGKGRVKLELFWVEGGKITVREELIDCLVGPQPPPDVDPIEPPKPKPPEPVTSFRVILIYESGQTIPASANGVFYGVAVEKWLTANCTSGKDGWDRLDKDNQGPRLNAEMKALWDAVRPKVTGTPCVAVARNREVEIIPLESSPAKMIEVLQTYRGK